MMQIDIRRSNEEEMDNEEQQIWTAMYELVSWIQILKITNSLAVHQTVVKVNLFYTKEYSGGRIIRTNIRENFA